MIHIRYAGWQPESDQLRKSSLAINGLATWLPWIGGVIYG